MTTHEPNNTPRLAGRTGYLSKGIGRAQLTLVEHSLCPLDTGVSLTDGLTHRSEFLYVDSSRHQQKAEAKIICPFGLSPGDEFYLWGLVALALSQPTPSYEFYATPHYCLAELGMIERKSGASGRGGKNYALFRQAIKRLAGVTYVNDHFYDPVRGERRSVAFGFLSYSLPENPTSSRAWRIVWDPIFFEYCQAARGSLLFDLETYRSLDFASRRLFLLLKKIFYRNPHSPAFDARHLGVNVLGFAPTIDVWNLKAKLLQCMKRLAEHDIITLAAGVRGTKDLFEKKGVGQYTIRFQRGSYFDKKPRTPPTLNPSQSALYEPLKSIGFDEAAIARIIAKYKPHIIQVWADITLAAKERSPQFFKVSPQAYFMDNVEKAANGTRTPPDWWYQHRKEANRRERTSAEKDVAQPAKPNSHQPTKDSTFEEYLRGEAASVFDEIVERLRSQNVANGQSPREAVQSALELARSHMIHRYRRTYPERDASLPKSLGEILKRRS